MTPTGLRDAGVKRRFQTFGDGQSGDDLAGQEVRDYETAAALLNRVQVERGLVGDRNGSAEQPLEPRRVVGRTEDKG